jgi:hypothetical protein
MGPGWQNTSPCQPSPVAGEGGWGKERCPHPTHALHPSRGACAGYESRIRINSVPCWTFNEPCSRTDSSYVCPASGSTPLP